MRVLVCGGRSFDDRQALYRVLDLRHAFMPIDTVIHGAQRGADSMAGDWAKSRKVKVEAFPANWIKYGRPAGVIRNAQMLAEGKPDFVIAFPGNVGTADMVKKARRANVPVILVERR